MTTANIEEVLKLALSSNSASIPYFSEWISDSFHAADPLLSVAPHDRTTRSSLQVHFISM